MRPRRWSSPTTGTRRAYAGGRNFGHLAYEVDDIYATCQRLMDHGSPSIARRGTVGWRYSLPRQYLRGVAPKGCRAGAGGARKSMQNVGVW